MPGCLFDTIFVNCFGVILDPFRSVTSFCGIVAPQMRVNLRIWLKFVIGIMPGIIGTVTPFSPHSSLEIEEVFVVEEELGDHEVGSGTDFLAKVVPICLLVRRFNVPFGVPGNGDA